MRKEANINELGLAKCEGISTSMKYILWIHLDYTWKYGPFARNVLS